MFEDTDNRTRYIVATLAFAALLVAFAASADATRTGARTEQTVKMAYVKHAAEVPPKLSNLELPPEDDGVRGGKQGIKDNNTTGQFLGHRYALDNFILAPDDDVQKAFEKEFSKGTRHFILDVGAADLLAAADSEQGKQSWFYNVGAGDDRLRTTDCRRNVLHVAPSHSMRADALAQYLIAKKWNRWLLVVGRRDDDVNFAAAVRRAAKKFGGKIVAEKPWEYGPDMRRTAASIVPLFTQDVDYDVLIVADVIGEFGEYLIYRTWTPRLVAGTQGLTPVAWHRSHEQWGAAQIQSRFFRNFGHKMSEKDYATWSAVRIIGEAVTRTNSADGERIASYVRGKRFEFAGYKGQKMSFRPWNLQLRQPILLTSPKSLVSVSPQRQFLHERSTLDTLGYDKQETSCQLEETAR